MEKMFETCWDRKYFVFSSEISLNYLNLCRSCINSWWIWSKRLANECRHSLNMLGSYDSSLLPSNWQISFSDAILFGEWLGRKKFSSVRQMSRKLLSFNPSQRMLDEAGSHVSDHPMRDARVLSQQYIRSLMSDCSNLTKQDLSKMLDL